LKILNKEKRFLGKLQILVRGRGGEVGRG